ncbi:MAG: hypothetical protein ACKPKO_36065, partial [Candidatus Fonsibacter sp.]
DGEGAEVVYHMASYILLSNTTRGQVCILTTQTTYKCSGQNQKCFCICETQPNTFFTPNFKKCH